MKLLPYLKWDIHFDYKELFNFILILCLFRALKNVCQKIFSTENFYRKNCFCVCVWFYTWKWYGKKNSICLVHIKSHKFSYIFLYLLNNTLILHFKILIKTIKIIIIIIKNTTKNKIIENYTNKHNKNKSATTTKNNQQKLSTKLIYAPRTLMLASSGVSKEKI